MEHDITANDIEEFEESLPDDIGEKWRDLVRNYYERLNYHIKAAWRADYDYFYECQKHNPDTPLATWFFASNSDEPPVDPTRYRVTRWDLKDVNDEEIRRKLREQ